MVNVCLFNSPKPTATVIHANNKHSARMASTGVKQKQKQSYFVSLMGDLQSKQHISNVDEVRHFLKQTYSFMNPYSSIRIGGTSLRWRHNGRDSISNHQPHDCLLNRLFRRRSKKTPKLPVTGLCGEFTGTGEFPAQMASYAENVSIWWRHRVMHSSTAGIGLSVCMKHCH